MIFRRYLVDALRRALAKRDRVIVPTMVNLGRERHIDVMRPRYTNEYIRLSHLDLAVDEIKTQRIQGDLAEVGVYKGDFASVLNMALPERTLYLFDTFDGFSEQEELHDQQRHGLRYKRDFTDTSVEYVLSQLPRPDKCVIRKGIFPASAAGLEDCGFSFVSLDADLYEPIRAGLEFFYPRLGAGGFIFVHDYNNSAFPGAKRAVLDFSASTGAHFVPVTDVYGTAIFRR